MSTPSANIASPRNREEIYGQLVPIENDTLLLPNSAVVEMRSMDEVVLRTEPPAWLLGTMRWRDHELPVISLEGIMNREVPARSRRTRVLVVNSLGVKLQTPMFALIAQGYPHLTALNRTAVQLSQKEKRDPETIVMARVRVANTLSLIPDLEAIERGIATAMGVR
jgi:chemosensory pili system protein ChpC